MPKIIRTPVTHTFAGESRKRELVFNLNSAILLREHGAEGARLVDVIGVTEDGKQKYRVDLGNLRLYLWAALQKDARRAGEQLSLEDAGDLVGPEETLEVLAVVNQAIERFYGVGEPGE